MQEEGEVSPSARIEHVVYSTNRSMGITGFPKHAAQPFMKRSTHRLRKFFTRHSRSNNRRVDEETPTTETRAVAESGSSLALPKSIAPVDAQRTPRQLPKIQFRVLIVGRANAGKTTILQRVCDTTESPKIYRRDDDGGREEVSGPTFVYASNLASNQVKLDPSVEVSDGCTLLRLLVNMEPARRARHRRRTGLLQSYGLRLPRFSWNRVW
jgi:hypothetical protein